MISGLLTEIDWDGYKRLDHNTKLNFGKTIYDIDSLLISIPEISRPRTDYEIMLCLKDQVEQFLNLHGCRGKIRQAAALEISPI